MQNVIIRPAGVADIAAITRIYADAVIHGTASFEIEPPDTAEMTRRQATLIGNGYPYLAAEIDGTVAGYAYAGPYRTRPAYKWSVEDSIYIAPEMHRKGIGGLLLNRLIEERAWFSADDCGDRRFRADHLNRSSRARWFQPGRHAARGRLQARQMARYRADAARAGKGR